MDQAMQEIEFAVRDGIATIALDNPDRLNRFSSQMRDELLRAFDATDADDDVRAVVLTGRGRAFCAGADLSEDGERFGLRDSESRDDHEDRGGVVALRIYRSLKPVIAAVNGAGVGFGATITLPADYRLFSERAFLRFPFVRLGIVPEACSAWFLPRVVGIGRALDWCYTGRDVRADEALASGLATSVHQPDDLLPSSYDLARRLSDGTAPVAVSSVRALMWRMLATPTPEEAHAVTSRLMFERGNSADCLEGMAAFREGRPAEFSQTVSRDFPLDLRTEIR
jgi:enoyl-CoA hydratase/carnithine racemase